ncbi:MAG: hypothetical protein IJV09_07975 [Prevotella sp.]|nr:hypothetical protein [Prevotella sp.]
MMYVIEYSKEADKTLRKWKKSNPQLFKTAYEYCNFHKQTKWGDWLNMVEKKPTKNNPAGEKSEKRD